jgi:hypothetical protein
VRDHVTREELEQLAMDELPEDLAARVGDHAARCEACARELDWLRAERALILRRARQAPPPAPELWARVEARAYAPVPLRRRRSWVAAAIAVAAAAALAVVVRPHLGRTPSVVADASPEADAEAPPEAVRALSNAEGQYKSAFSTLEAEYARNRGRLDRRTQERWDRAVERTRVQLAVAETAAQGDVNARLRVLDGYAQAVRSLSRAVEETEEAAR